MPALPPLRPEPAPAESTTPRPSPEDTLAAPRGTPPATPVTPPGGSPGDTVLTPRGTPGMTPPVRRETEPPGALPRGGALPTNAKRHTVAEGDSLWSIAQSYYGDGNQWPKLKAANPGLDETSLKVGQVVIVPQDAPASPAGTDASRTRATPNAQTDAAPGTPAGGRLYVVEEGDSLASIARNLLGSGERWREIYELNKSKISNPNVLLVGTELRLPEGATPPRPTTERGTTERRAAPRQGRSTTPPAARPAGGSRSTPPAAQPTTPPTRSGTRRGETTTPRRTSSDRRGTSGAALRPVRT
jgi:nucleoid-associated protein YgaU